MPEPDASPPATTVPSERLPQIHTLWDELADFGAHDTDAAVMHVLGATSRLIDAQQAFWIGTVRMAADSGDPLGGWRLRALRRLHDSEQDR